MRLVETVAGELVDQIEQLVGRLGRQSAKTSPAAFDEARRRCCWSISAWILLAHRAAQQIGITERIARQDLRGLHHLFLIDEDAVGFGQDAFELRVRIFDRHLARLALAEQRDVVHRARAIERDERDDVAEIGRLHRGQRAPHAFGFQLEDAHSVPDCIS